jgi:hypothetical protein
MEGPNKEQKIKLVSKRELQMENDQEGKHQF